MTSLAQSDLSVQGTPAKGTWLPALIFPIVYAGLLLVIPSRLVVAQIGAPGTPANLWGILALLVWAVMTIGGLNPAGRSPMRIAIGCLGLTVLLSYVAGNVVGWYQPADIHQTSDQLWRAANVEQMTEAMVSAGDRGLLALAGWTGILLMTMEGLRSWRELEILNMWVVRLASVTAALGLVQYFTGLNVAALIRIPGLSPLTDLVTFQRSVVNRVVSTAGHPIELGVVMATILPLALHHSIFRRRLVSWIPTVMIGLIVLMSVSRSAIVVAAGVMVVLLIGWPNRWRITFLVAAPFAAVAARAAFPGLLGTIQALFLHLGDDPSIDGRTADYDLVWRAFGENPILGKGLFTWVPMLYRTLDNQMLVLLLELGIVGTIAFVGVILTGVVCGINCRRRAPALVRSHLGLAIAAGLIGMSLSYVTFDTLGFRQASGITFLFLGLAGAAWRLAPRPDEPLEVSPYLAEPRQARV